MTSIVSDPQPRILSLYSGPHCIHLHTPTVRVLQTQVSSSLRLFSLLSPSLRCRNGCVWIYYLFCVAAVAAAVSPVASGFSVSSEEGVVIYGSVFCRRLALLDIYKERRVTRLHEFYRMFGRSSRHGDYYCMRCRFNRALVLNTYNPSNNEPLLLFVFVARVESRLLSSFSSVEPSIRCCNGGGPSTSHRTPRPSPCHPLNRVRWATRSRT